MQGEVLENVPLVDTLEQMSGAAPGTASHSPATSLDVPAPRQLESSDQLSAGLSAAVVLVDGQPAPNLSKAGPSAHQAAARPSPRHASAPEKGKAAMQADAASQAKPSDSAVPSSAGATQQAGPSLQAPSHKAVLSPPPAARKRPPTPGETLQPTKKRPALEGALPPTQSLAAAQLVQGSMQAFKSANAAINKQVHYLG